MIIKKTILYVVAFFVPPIAVLIVGSKKQFVINILFCFLFWIPAIVHAIAIVNKIENEQNYDNGFVKMSDEEFKASYPDFEKESEPTEQDTINSMLMKKITELKAGVNMVEATNTKETPEVTDIKKEFSVAGTNFRQKELKSLCSVNENYKMTKKELIELYMIDEKIYQYDFIKSKADIVEETEKDEFPGSLRIIVKNVHIGYIKKIDVDNVKNILQNKDALIEVFIYGGKYKYLYETTNTESEIESVLNDREIKETFELEKGGSDLFAKVVFTIKS